MLLGLRKASIVCFVVVLCLLFSVSQVSAQETGTLIVYTEAQGGDAAFSYTGSGSLGSFQIATEGNGGAKVFDLPAGTYTITQNSIPANWTNQEIFCDGTGTFSVDQSNSKATVTIASAADFVYLRFTNENLSGAIPEFPAIPVILGLVVVVSLSVVFLARKRRVAAPVFAVLFIACLLLASIGSVLASPGKFVQMGTNGDDEQTQFGTPNKDVIVQLGFGGNDTQYAESAAGDDWIIQNGGSGNDDMTAISGYGNNHIIQEGGDGNNVMYADLETSQGENGWAIVNAGKGDDIIFVFAARGANQITLQAEEGNDNIHVSGGHGDDSIRIEAGSGDDTMRYDLTSGKDSVSIDGGSENDFLTINKNQQSIQLVDGTGNVLFKVGENGSTITILSVEHGQVLGDDGKVAFQW